ncbi:hypothetical protein [Jatrophihabitans sp.]|uniref:hypothetical protein n=1 Tax=Jatrophihabitans sp. TaxID=1932789 RepID=UPI002C63255C|nr:hypothetical protein [Jatrophihabitans sp.]
MSTVIRSHRRGAAVVSGMAGICLLVSVVTATPAFATGATLTPDSQTVSTTQFATYGAAWNGHAPFTVTLAFGDGSSNKVTGTTATSKGYSHQFSFCNARSKTFTEKLTVVDAAGLTATATVHTTVTYSGTLCQ